MLNPLARHVKQLGLLSASDERAFDGLITRLVNVTANTDLVQDGDRPLECYVILDGFACSYKLMADGERQIINFHVAGDVCGLHGLLSGRMDYSIGSISCCTIAVIEKDQLLDLTQTRPSLARVLWRTMQIESAVLRERIVGLGRRSASSRLAHLLCEMRWRLDAVGLVRSNSFPLPITQAQLGDALGLSTIHLNRVIQQLRSRNLFTLQGGTVTIHDWHGLCDEAHFNPGYLQLEEQSNEVEIAPTARAPKPLQRPNSLNMSSVA